MLKCKCISRLTVYETAYVRDAYAMLIASAAMCAYLFDWSTNLDCSVDADNVVISASSPAAVPMPSVDFGGCNVTALLGRGAVDYDFCQSSHSSSEFNVCYSTIVVRGIFFRMISRQNVRIIAVAIVQPSRQRYLEKS